MNKKFLSAILFVAMLVTSIGTFVSCKDYDDDISSLQSQIDGLSSSSSSQSASLTSLQASLESDLATVKSSLESELASAQSTLESEITAAKAELQVAMSSKADASEITALSDKIASLNLDLAGTESSLTAQITAVNTALTQLQTSSSTADDALQAAIDALSTSTSSGDAALQAAIDALKTSTSAELQTAIDALTTSTSNSDNALQAAIDALKSSTDGSSAALQTAIDSLEIKFNASCEALNKAISELQGSSSDADALLQKAIDKLEDDSATSAANYADLKAAVELLSTSVSTGDEELQAAIDDLKKAAEADYQTLLKEITDLQSSGEEAYTELVKQITDLATSSDEADATLQKLIDVLTADTAASVAALQDADADLQAAINDLKSSTSTSYEELVQSIKDLADSSSSADSKLQALIDALETTTSTNASSIEDVKANVAELTITVAALSESGVSSEDLQNTVDALNAYIESVELNLTAQLTKLQSDFSDANDLLDVLSGQIAQEIQDRKDADDELLEKINAGLQLQSDALDNFKEEIANSDFQGQIDQVMKYLSEDVKAKIDGMDAIIADLQDQIDALQTSIDDNNITKDELETALNQLSSDINDNLTASVNAVSLLIGGYVTSVELVISYTADNRPSNDLKFSAAIVQANVFAEGVNNAITFKEGDLVQVAQTFVVRVSPVNAELTADMIHFVNSQGDDLDEYVEVTGVQKYNDLLTTTRAAATGLWTISAQLKNGIDKDDFIGKTAKTDNDGNILSHILYAVQINNTLDTDADRYVTSTYDLTMEWEEYAGENKLNYTVGDTDVAELNNRYTNSDTNPSLEFTETTAEITYVELGWTGDAAVSAITTGSDVNAAQDTSDDRSEKNLYEAQVGEDIVVTIYATDAEGKQVDPTNIRAMFVALDFEENAIESAPSEWNSWTLAYSFTGLNTVVDAEETGYPLSATIKVNSTAADGDIIGFRVFAVNYDGTLVDPDGKAFYVSLGEVANKNWGELATTITPEAEETYDTESTLDALDLSGTSVSNAISASWTTDEIEETTPIFNIVMVDKDGNPIAYTNSLGHLVDYYTRSEITDYSSVDWASVANIYTTIRMYPMGSTSHTADSESPCLEWYQYEDNKPYTGTLTFTGARGVIGTITVTMTKVLPTELPTSISVKSEQLSANGNYYAFMIPYDENDTESWTASSAENGTGRMAMSQIFNFFSAAELKEYDETEQDEIIANYKILFADTDDKDEDGEYTDTQTVDGDGSVIADAVLVDNETSHKTTVTYDYGKISSVTEDNHHIVTGESFNTVYVSIYYEKAYHWAWSEDAVTNGDDQLTYGTAKTIAYADILGTSDKDSRYNTNAYGLGGTYQGSLTVESATLTTKEGPNAGLEEYFAVTTGSSVFTFTPDPEASNVVDPVESTLTINCVDSYGNPVTITLDMTVNKR